MAFKIGDVVKLKSGGPRMTVDSVQDEKMWCTWQDTSTGDTKTMRHGFHPDMLDEYKANT